MSVLIQIFPSWSNLSSEIVLKTSYCSLSAKSQQDAQVVTVHPSILNTERM